MVRNHGHWLRRWHDQAFALIQGDLKFKISHAQPVAIEQAARISPAERFFLVVDVDAIAANVGQVVGAGLKINGGVLAGNELIRIRQNPVILQ